MPKTQRKEQIFISKGVGSLRRTRWKVKFGVYGEEEGEGIVQGRSRGAGEVDKCTDGGNNVVAEVGVVVGKGRDQRENMVVISMIGGNVLEAHG